MSDFRLKPLEPITRIQLDQIRCKNGCDNHPVDITSKCHPEAPVHPAYDRKSGSLVMACAVCDKIVLVVSVEVGSAGDS